MQSCLRERRKEQIRSRQAPDDRPLRPGGDPGGEQRRGSAIDRSGSTTRELVQRSMGQTAAGQNVIDLCHSERKTA